jgi:hypothetical protein
VPAYQQYHGISIESCVRMLSLSLSISLSLSLSLSLCVCVCVEQYQLTHTLMSHREHRCESDPRKVCALVHKKQCAPGLELPSTQWCQKNGWSSSSSSVDASRDDESYDAVRYADTDDADDDADADE